jgi:hypothetical protein
MNAWHDVEVGDHIEEHGAARHPARAGHRGDHDARRQGDDKIIAVPVDDPEYTHYREASELSPHRVLELQRFFLDDNVLEHKTVDLGALRGRAEAEDVVRDAIRLYRDRIKPDV